MIQTFKPIEMETVQAIQLTPETFDEIVRWMGRAVYDTDVALGTVTFSSQNMLYKAILSDIVLRTQDGVFHVLPAESFSRAYELVPG